MLGVATADKGTTRGGRSKPWNGEQETRIEEQDGASEKQTSAQFNVFIYMQKIKYFETTDQKGYPARSKLC